jgi:EpsI family protein
VRPKNLPLAITLWAAAPVLCFLQFYRPPDVGGSRAVSIASKVGEWQRKKTFALTDRMYSLLGTRDVLWCTYADASGAEVAFTAVFHAANWKSVHPPDVCIMGSGYTIESADAESVSLAGEQKPLRVGRIVASGEGGRLVSYFLFGTRDFTTPSYISFFLHHVPSALLRSATEGFVLRVECLEGSDPEAARARCLRFLVAVLPTVQEVMR